MTRRLSPRTTSTRVVGTVLGLALAGAGVPLVAAATPSSDTPSAGTTNEQLTQMREEERLARDVYTALADSTGAAIFSRIADSEQRHLDAVEQLMSVRGVSAPTGSTPGRYAVDGFDDLYDTWVSAGSVSAEAAYDVGVEIEMQDINDLTEALEATSDARVEQVLSALLTGSEHHLAAFRAASDGSGVNEVCDPGSGAGMMRSGAAQGYGPGMGGGGHGPAWGDDT